MHTPSPRRPTSQLSAVTWLNFLGKKEQPARLGVGSIDWIVSKITEHTMLTACSTAMSSHQALFSVGARALGQFPVEYITGVHSPGGLS